MCGELQVTGSLLGPLTQRARTGFGEVRVETGLPPNGVVRLSSHRGSRGAFRCVVGVAVWRAFWTRSDEYVRV